MTRNLEQGLKEIGREILERCPKVPLVIRAIGGLLREEEPNKHRWQAFRDGPLRNLSLTVPDVMQSLKLSYNQLDLRLKLCFAYCSLFPCGCELDKDGLLSTWIALGYIEARNETQSLEDAGEEYVLNLMNRGFFQNAKKDNFGCIINFRMHDSIYDLAVQVAGSKYKRTYFGSAERYHELDETVRHASFSGKVLSISGNLPHLLHKNEEKVQSLVIRDSRQVNSKVQLNVLLRFRCLRVLRIPDAGLGEVPESLGKLIHLRSLDLSDNGFEKLPHSIGRLVNLLSLDLFCCRNLKELPMDASKLVKLRHLNLDKCSNLTHMPFGLGNLMNLQKLPLFVAGEDRRCSDMEGLEELKRLNNLKGRLEIMVNFTINDEDWVGSTPETYARAATLNGKEKLVSLSIDLHYKQPKEKSKIVLEVLQRHPNLGHLHIERYDGERLPSWMMSWGQLPYNSLPNLVETALYGFENCRYLRSFGRLPHLKFLKLGHMEQLEYVENKSTTSNNRDPSPSNVLATASATDPLFPSLETLNLWRMPRLNGWRKIMWTSSASSSTSEEESLVLQRSCYYSAFRRLRELVFYEVGLDFVPEEFRDLSALESLSLDCCYHLMAVPEWIDTLTSLKQLSIVECSKLRLLPKQMANLSNLEKLKIEACPNLEEKCKKPTGEDWPLIQHIPRVRIGLSDY